jgi:peptidoglycan L-alanyl-D-glutamate endopeptidase CwlK
MKLGEHQECFSRNLVQLLSKAFELGYEVRIGEVERTKEQQELYIKQGRSTTMNSMHLVKCAADLHFVKNKSLQYPEELGTYWQSLDSANQWGGFWDSFKDYPHFQRTVK